MKQSLVNEAPHAANSNVGLVDTKLETLNTHLVKATFADLSPIITSAFVNYFGVSENICRASLEDAFADYIKRLAPKLMAVIEYPYVDRMYRDSYYNFFAKKLRNYKRDTIRISFFKPGIKEGFFLSDKEEERDKIQNGYLGFLVLRPTFPQIIGRNIISREALKECSFLTCNANFNITVNSVKLKLRGYPHASQDDQSIKCAETSLWALLEYFGNKFPDYTPILPSKIHKILFNYSYKRLLPSDGLTGEQLGYSLRELDFSPVCYARLKNEDEENEEFETLINVYIESGLPVLGLIGNDNLSHCVNIIGREIDNRKAIIKSIPTVLPNGAKIIDYNALPNKKYIVMDDNLSPYSQIGLEDPCKLYLDKDGNSLPAWQDCKLDSIIVPLPHKVYLDASEARLIFNNILCSEEYGLDVSQVHVVKIFIATSRTFKDYIAKGDMHNDVKEHFLHLPMAKFIYVAEISELQCFKNGQCNGLLLLDATEPSIKGGEIVPMSFLAGYKKVLKKECLTEDAAGLFFRQDFGNFLNVPTFAKSFKEFKENLM